MIFIAEIGMNHNGNFGLLHELIKQASLSGADIAKFQLGWRCGKGEINQIDSETINLIEKISGYYEIKPMFSIITREAFEMAKKFSFKRYKIASRTLKEDFELVQMIVDQKKETYISFGFWDKSELPFQDVNHVKRLWCKSNYPTAPWEVDNFPKTFSNENFHGLSDHTIGIELPLLAIARGARVIEKHFTLDKSDTTIRDHALSLNPQEFKQLVYLGKSMYKMMQKIT